MIIIVDKLKYEFSQKQFKTVKRLIKSNNFNAVDFTSGFNQKEYKQIIHKYNIFPLDIDNG